MVTWKIASCPPSSPKNGLIQIQMPLFILILLKKMYYYLNDMLKLVL